jgi:hypothetical protein
MKNIILKITMTVFFFLTGLLAFAQEGPDGIPNPTGLDDDPVASIDQAIIWLIAAAVLLGAYVMLKQRKAVVK